MNINLTLFGQMITFALFVWFTMKYVWPPVMLAMQERQKRIQDGLAAAEKGQRLMVEAQAEAAKQLAHTQQEIRGIVGEAQIRAQQIVDAAKEQARQEGERLLKQAQVDIEQAVLQARTVLRQEVADIALRGTEALLTKEVDPTVHQRLLDDLSQAL